MFSPEYFCTNHQRFARKISVTRGAAAPLAPPARTPMRESLQRAVRIIISDKFVPQSSEITFFRCRWHSDGAN